MMANMNLNILTEILNNFQKTSGLQGDNKSTLAFQDIFNSTDNLFKDIDLHIENEDDDSINYEFIQSILSNLQTMDFDEFIKLEENSSLSIEENSSLNIKEFIKNNNDFTKLLSEDIEALDKLINEIKSNKELSIDMNNLKEKHVKFNLVKEIFKKLNTSLDTSSENIVARQNVENTKIKEELYKFEIYNQLEVNSLYNKNNILEKSMASSFKDEDMKTLETILDTDNNSSVMIQNNSLNTTNLNSVKDVSLNEVPINNIRQEFISEDIIKTIKYLKSNKMEEINIKISPKELGDMTIKLIKSDQETKVLITISKEDIFELVNKNSHDIVKHLNDLNMKVKDVSVDIKNNNEKFFSDNLNQEFSRKNQENKKKRNKYEQAKIEEIEEIKENNIVEDNINILI